MSVSTFSEICIPENEIGSGAWRTVYREPGSGYVVKIDCDYNGDQPPSFGTNKHEWETYQFVTENVILPDGVRIPKMALVGNMIVAQYIKGRHPAYTEYGWHDKVRSVPLHDKSNSNVIIDDEGIVWLIDLGNGSSLTREQQ